MNRRQFLVGTSAGILSAHFSALARPERKLSAIGLQLYSVRDEMKRDFDGSLQKVASIGYTEVEFAGYFDHSPRDVRAALDGTGLRSPASHIPYDQIEKSMPAVLDAAQVIGQEYVVCPSVEKNRLRTIEDVKNVVEVFNNAGARCKKAGLQFAYHNHDFDFEPVGGKMFYDVLLAETDPQLVKFEMDLYWVVKANQRPLDYFARYPGRFPMVHVKDMDHTPARGQTEVGRGIIDFKEIFPHSDQAGIRHYFVEQEDLANPWPSMQINFEYLRDLRF
ncbi:MAG TPA: sugar phosphate isomerase/epimerase [Candidatus Acidoferrum sp.]|nr:sugar phosphate isomerase/epimerase [Candidatus Acidoferrum sp.]